MVTKLYVPAVGERVEEVISIGFRVLETTCTTLDGTATRGIVAFAEPPAGGFFVVEVPGSVVDEYKDCVMERTARSTPRSWCLPHTILDYFFVDKHFVHGGAESSKELK
jgi:hypothetical protein